MAADDNDDGQRYSSLSFGGQSPIGREGPSATVALLDAISSGQVLGESEYEFFDTQELSHLAANAWAGSAHWKPLAHLHKPKATNKAVNKTNEKKTRSTKASKERAFVDLTQKSPDLSDILRKPPKAKSRRANDPLQLAAASITKYTKNENLLPPDVGIRPNVLSSLFLRPNSFIKPQNVTNNNSTKTVGFAMDQVETYGGNNDWDDGSFGGGGGGDDDDGPGFAMADDSDGENDDFVVEELEGIRKVDKVSVSYATIAKKVDVKRLKRDLWNELESYFEAQKEKDEEKADDDDDDVEEMPSTPTGVNPSGPLSFQETVRAMEASKTQVDVTLPFYFICILHLANEKGLRLDSTGLEDFVIYNGDGTTGSFF
jgi:condensin complex subunit 2